MFQRILNNFVVRTPVHVVVACESERPTSWKGFHGYRHKQCLRHLTDFEKSSFYAHSCISMSRPFQTSHLFPPFKKKRLYLICWESLGPWDERTVSARLLQIEQVSTTTPNTTKFVYSIHKLLFFCSFMLRRNT